MGLRDGAADRAEGPDPRLTPLLDRHGLTWEEFSSPVRPPGRIMEGRKAVVRDLQVEGRSWAEMREITGMSHGFVQRNRDPSLSLMPEPVVGACGWCGSELRTSRGGVTRGRGRYCSHACQGQASSAAHQVEHTCNGCGHTFKRRASGTREGSRPFCSKACADAGLVKRVQVLDRAAFDYLLGVVCGDGSILRQERVKEKGVTVCVGFTDEGYVEVLRQMFVRALGEEPLVRPNPVARAISVNLHGTEVGKLFGSVKTKDGWVLDEVRHPAEFLAGLCDTDGSWAKKRGVDTRRSFTITQKDNGNLERTFPLWEAAGVPVKLHHYDKGYARVVLRVGADGIESFKEHVPLRHPRKCAADR